MIFQSMHSSLRQLLSSLIPGLAWNTKDKAQNIPVNVQILSSLPFFFSSSYLRERSTACWARLHQSR